MGDDLALGKPLLDAAVRSYPHRVVRRSALVNADALDFLPMVPTGSVDLIFADPPYLLSNNGSTCSGGARVSVNKGSWDVSQSLQRDHDFHRSWIRCCQRILRPSGTIFISGTQHSIFSVGWALQAMGWHLLNTISWFKPNASPNLGCRQLTHSTELVIWAAPARHKKLLHTFNDAIARAANDGKQLRDVWGLNDTKWDIPVAAQKEKALGGHPTQKPYALLERIISIASSSGDLVLDPFVGSGTAGVAALQLGRRFIGIDSDAKWLDIAQKRMEA